MSATSSFKKTTVSIAATAAVLTGAGCTAVTSGVAMSDRDSADSMSTASVIDSTACADVDAPKVDIPAVNSTEPQLRIPQPDGWVSNAEFGPGQELLRLTMVSPESVTAEGSHDGVIVAVEQVPNDGTEAILADARASLMEELPGLGLPTDITVSRTTICGQPAELYTYENYSAARGDVPPASFLHVVTQTRGQTYLVMVLVGGPDDSLDFLRDAETILTGFEVLPAANT